MNSLLMSPAVESVRITKEGKRVHSIPARVRRTDAEPVVLQRKLRVAAYARVSTDMEEQETSFDAQVEYFTNYIKANPEWELVEVYQDDGKSATSMVKREGFNRMIADALSGKIDRIYTKSISRFARNTVDSLTLIRQLKAKGVGVTFEKENIDTMDSKGELLITIMSSIAQEESRSISENVTWGWRKRLADGKVSVGYKHFLGYEKGEDGTMQVVEREAETVRYIYGLFLDGLTPSAIAVRLTSEHILTPAKKERWTSSTVLSILTNEKYKGDSIQQKTVTVDFLTKQTKVNEGEAPQHYVENSHPAIVSREVFDLVQLELARRRKQGRHTSAGSIFSSRIFCAECGSSFGSKVWHSNDPYRCTIWRCNRKYDRNAQSDCAGNAESGNTDDTTSCGSKRRHRCSTPHLREEEIKSAFIQAVNMILSQKEAVFAAFDDMIPRLCDTAALQKEQDRLKVEEELILNKIAELVHDNTTHAQDQDEYKQKYNALVESHEAMKSRQSAVKTQIAEKSGRKRKLELYMTTLREQDAIDEFDEQLFLGTVDQIVVSGDKSRKKLTFRFKDGNEIEIEA